MSGAVDDFGIPIGGQGPIDANNLEHYAAAPVVAAVTSEEVPLVPNAVVDDKFTSWWILPKEDQKFKSVYSHALLNPMESYILGTNGRFAFAFTTVDKDIDRSNDPLYDEKKKYSLLEKAALQDKIHENYAKQNPCFRYKWATTQLEREAAAVSTTYSIKHELFVKDDAKTKLAFFKSMVDVDLTMVKPMQYIATLLNEKLKTLPETDDNANADFRQVKPEDRPGKNINIEFSVMPPLADGEAAPPLQLGAYDCFKLLLCKVPTQDPTKWKEYGNDFMFKCESNTVPIACFNDTHFIVLYQVPGKPLIQVRHYELEPQDGSGHYIRPVRDLDFVFTFPVDFGATGFFGAFLSNDANKHLLVVFGTGVLVFPKKKNQDVSVYRIHPSDKYIRLITCANMVNNHLMIGTDSGECFTLDIFTKKLVQVEVTPAIEPIFSIHAKEENPGRCVLHSVFNLSGRMSTRPEAPNTLLELRRPVALDSEGSLVFVLTKYGFINIIHADMRKVARILEPPYQIHTAPPLQHAYKGIRVFKDKFVCVYQNGIVRSTRLDQ
ncbi:MAG: hypothetical protein K2Q45_03145 [Nitrosomonas sp.]|nr:hypothetical protein [Nitrosomonas sp.]